MMKSLISQLIFGRFLCLGIAALSYAELSYAETPKKTGIVEGRSTKGLSIELISELKSIQAGQPFKVGLKIQHDPKFHTYWKNPGIVGVPTDFDWKLPEGFTASEIHWPYPELSSMADYPCFGYERDILLYVTITPPKVLKEKEITITTDAKWMCCADTCYPDFKSFSLSLPIGKQTFNDKYIAIFKKAETSIPKHSEKFTAKLLSQKEVDTIKIHITAKENFTPIRIFNSDGQTTPDLPHTLKKLTDNKWMFIAKRSEYFRNSRATFPFILQTKNGYFDLTAK